jgi:uncharacterized protein (DUF697 family)
VTYIRDFVDHLVESVTGVFAFDIDPDRTEHQNVEKVITETSLVAAMIACIQPIPAADILVLSPLQAKMAVHIGKAKGFEVSQERALEMVTEIMGVVWITVASQLVIGGLAKLLPIVGGIMTFPLNYAATYAIGQVVDYYFDCIRQGEKPQGTVMKDLFARQFKVGKTQGQQLDRDDLQRRAEELRRKVAERDPAMKTKTRLEPKGSGSSVGGGATKAAGSDAGGRRKIKITLSPKGEGKDEDVAGEAPRQGVKKTIGLGDVDPPAKDPDAKSPTKFVGDPTPAGGVPVVTEAAIAAHSKARSADELLEKKAPAPEESPAEPPESSPEPPESSPEPPESSPESPEPSQEPERLSGEELLARLERLAKLKEQGILSDEEFLAAKKKILG